MEHTRYHGSLNLESFGSLFVIQRRKKHLPAQPKPVSKRAQAVQSFKLSAKSVFGSRQVFSFSAKKTNKPKKEEDVLP